MSNSKEHFKEKREILNMVLLEMAYDMDKEAENQLNFTDDEMKQQNNSQNLEAESTQEPVINLPKLAWLNNQDSQGKFCLCNKRSSDIDADPVKPENTKVHPTLTQIKAEGLSGSLPNLTSGSVIEAGNRRVNLTQSVDLTTPASRSPRSMDDIVRCPLPVGSKDFKATMKEIGQNKKEPVANKVRC